MAKNLVSKSAKYPERHWHLYCGLIRANNKGAVRFEQNKPVFTNENTKNKYSDASFELKDMIG